MPKLLQINVTANQGSTGKIAEQIGKIAIEHGWESWIAYGRGTPKSTSNLIRIGNDIDKRMHALGTRIFDNQGLLSKRATVHLIEQIKKINPDIIHLHNIHGYYINYPVLFHYLKLWGGPVVWTLHDCWPITGHCVYFMMNGCEKWKTGCNHCPSKIYYPGSYLLDNSENNYKLKKGIFSAIESNLTLVPVSEFVGDYLKDSFLKNAEVEVIHNGVDTSIFKPYAEPKDKLILGVANIWEPRKGYDDFVKLRRLLDEDYKILLVGLKEKQISKLPAGIQGISRTNNQIELAKLYSKSLALVNPTYEDNLPTVNIEAIACGTPVITYKTGGAPETIDSKTGVVLEQGDIKGIANSIAIISQLKSEDCRERALTEFNMDIQYREYLNLYNSLLNK